MKKLLTAMVSVCMAIIFSGCNKDEAVSSVDDIATTTVTERTTTTEEETTTSTTETTTSTTEETTTQTEESELIFSVATTSRAQRTTTTAITTTAEETTTTKYTVENVIFLRNCRGTYYGSRTFPLRGGSGRTLISCSEGNEEVKGSVASRFIFENYGYCRDGRTKIYIEVPRIPEMDGWYYVDDCNARGSVVDFYYHDYSKCPFQQAGVIDVKVYILE